MEIRLEQMQGEEREGYYVQPLMKRIWAVQLDILKELSAICRNHNIKYYGWYGTLLGAVRHQGFIPWDDDMDLAMAREDYEKFRYYVKKELPTGYQALENEPTLITVFNTDRVRLEQDFLDKFHGCPFQTGIDIFCLDRIPKHKADETVWLELFWAVHVLCLNWNVPEEDEQWEDKSKWDYLKEIEELTGRRIDRQHPIKEQLYFLGDKIAAMYWDAEYDDVTNIGWLHDRNYFRIPKNCFDKTIEVPFENMIIPIPGGYDLICRLAYGEDYMVPIKECKHDYLKDQVEQLRKYFESIGEVMPEVFDMTFE